MKRDVKFTVNMQEYLGTVEEILEDGSLSVLCRNGQIRIVQSGEVQEKFL